MCNSAHFYGYIIDKVSRKIVFVDSKYKEKGGKRARSNVLKERYFENESVEVVDFYPYPVQHDNHRCGGWLVFGMIQYAFYGMETDPRVSTREKVFDLLVVTIDDLTLAEK